MRKWFFIPIVAGLLFLLYIFFKPAHSNELVLFGNVDIRQVDLGFRVRGRVDKVFVDEGDFVTKGQLIALLDQVPFLDTLKQAEGDVAATKASYENALILYQRRLELIKTKAVSQEDLDDALSNKLITKGQYEAALGRLASAQTDLEDTKIFAPNDGHVLTRIREPGSIANFGEPIITVSLKSPVWVRAYVNEPNLGRITFGMKGVVSTDVKGGRTYVGHIGFISPVAEFTPKTVETTDLRTDLVYRLRLIIDDPDPFLLQGMPVTVNLSHGFSEKNQKTLSGDDKINL